MDQRLGSLSAYYCPLCGDRETLGGVCICGLRWNEKRRQFAHYARLLTWQDAEKLRHLLARRKTRALVEACAEHKASQAPGFCVPDVLARMWHDPE